MMNLCRPVASLIVTIACVTAGLGELPAAAAVSGWTEGPGGRARMVIDPSEVATSSGDASGKQLRGVLQVDLQPGWKTYWLAPGSGGIPPQITVNGTARARLDYPVPVELGSGDDAGFGYTAPVLLPVTFSIDSSQPKIEGQAFLGMCNNICIPVQVPFAFDFTASAAAGAAPGQSALAHALVTTAFDRLPAPANDRFGVRTAVRHGNVVTFDLAVPDIDKPAELFLAGESVDFAPANRLAGNGKAAVMTARILGDAKASSVFYTLVQDGQSVSGTVAVQ